MKIYAARLSNADSDVFLDNQIGRDVWVRCRTKSDYDSDLSDSSQMSDPVYIHFVDKLDNGHYVGTVIESNLIDTFDPDCFYDMVYLGPMAYDELSAPEVVDNLLTCTETLPLRVFPTSPLELRTTSEIKEALAGYAKLELSYDDFHDEGDE